jgi:hypothetical protein
VTIDHDTAVEIGAVSQAVSELLLREGRVASNVTKEEGFVFRVVSEESGAVAEAEEGRFDALRRGSGPLVVASRDARVVVSAQGRKETIEGGEQTSVTPGEPPTKAAPVPPSLFLKLAQNARRIRQTKATVEGQTTPSAVVSVGGVYTTADAAGRFTVEVPLQEGENAIDVNVEDVMGRRDTAAQEVFVDSKAPPVRGKVTW